MKNWRACRVSIVVSVALSIAGKSAAIGCESLQKHGVFIDTIRATSDTTRLIATVNLYEDNGDIVGTKEATIHLETGTVVEGFDAPDGTTVQSSGLGASLDFSKYKYVLDVDPNSQEYLGSVVDSQTGEKITFALPDLKQNDIGQEVVLWFVSQHLQRTYVFYEYIFFSPETLQRLAGSAPRVVAVVAPIPGGEGAVTYLAYENFLESISFGGGDGFDGRMTVFEDLRLAVVPQNTCTATTMYYKTNGVELRNLGSGPFDVGGMTAAAEPGADFVYKADHVVLMGRPNGYVVYKTNLWTGEQTEFPLNADQVLGLLGQIPIPVDNASGKTSAASWKSLASTCSFYIALTSFYFYTILC